ncbi:MAG TPA: peptidoglycan binding domain-containing protein, partial [Chloroflexota bacterium]|nr:peptidoglycan binding domain-containing protein [Chloroflexota bacterium]
MLLLLGFRLAYASRIYPGILIRGVPIGGQTPSAARGELLTALGRDDQSPLTVRVGTKEWDLPRSRLGGTDDVDRLVDRAFSFGRSGSIAEQLATSVGALLFHRDLAPVRELDFVDWPALLDPIRTDVDRPPVDSKLSISPDHRAQIQPEIDGVQLDVALAKQVIAASAVGDTITPVQLPVQVVPPATRAADLKPLQEQIQKVLIAPIDLTYDGVTYEYSVDQIQAALELLAPQGRGPRSLEVDQVAVARFVDGIAASIDRPPRDAVIVLDGEQVVVRPGQSALRVNRPATIARIQTAFFSDSRSILVVVDESPPSIVQSDLVPVAERANLIIGSSVIVAGPDQKTWPLAPTDLRRMLILPVGPPSSADGWPRLDGAKLAAFVNRVASEVDLPPSNARFHRTADGQVQVTRSAVPGRSVNQADAVDIISRAADSTSRTVDLPVTVIMPRITDSEATALQSLVFIADNSTSYVGSIPPRRHNVELATSLLDGVVVPPGEIFSFNHELGPTTLDRGFQVGFGIQTQGDSVKTVPSVAGGICQVATTLFQPVFWAGYSIEERYSHLYWIAHYVSRGLVGLDTTVDEEAGLDFRFKNDTASDLLIQTSTDGS